MIRIRYKIILLIPFVVFIITSCVRIYDKQKLSIANNSFKQENITFRTDGYYYKIIEYQEGENLSIEMQYGESNFCAISPLIFYNDGFVRKSEFIHEIRKFKTEQDMNDSINISLLSLDEEIETNNFHVQMNNTIWDWGMYEQNYMKITIQYYRNHHGNYRLIEQIGEVKNNTTIILKNKQTIIRNDDLNNEPEEIYYFRKLKIKPDSTNYIKSNIEKFRK